MKVACTMDEGRWNERVLSGRWTGITAVWSYISRCWPARPRIRVPRLSDEWLRVHALESEKHRNEL